MQIFINVILICQIVFDASGKPGSGIYGGNSLWYGSYSECQKLTNSRYCLTVFPGKVFIGGTSEVRQII